MQNRFLKTLAWWAIVLAFAAPPTADLRAQDDNTNTPDTSQTTPAENNKPNESADGDDKPAIKSPPFSLIKADKAPLSKLGSTDESSNYMMGAEFTSWGAGIYRLRLNRYHDKAIKGDPYVILEPLEVNNPPGSDEPVILQYAFAARWVKVNGHQINLAGAWQNDAPGEYSAIIAGADGETPVLRITRKYTLPQGDLGYELRCVTTFTDLRQDKDAEPLKIEWKQNAQTDIPIDTTRYMGDRRLVTAAYFSSKDPNRVRAYIKDARNARSEVIDDQLPVFPDPDVPEAEALTWVAFDNRYFSLITHMPVDGDPDLTPGDIPPLSDTYTLEAETLGEATLDAERRGLMISLTSRSFTLSPGKSESFELALFAGPRHPELFNAQPYAAMQFDELIVYELGCAFCTFQWLAKGLLWFLNFFHDIVFDWSFAIIILVIFVRICLHPITKKSQISMTKMSKQMAALQPELEKLKKKYSEDPKKLQQEQMKLYREKNINPAGMLGCLPMFLQTPIWIALYAMLYYAIDLRHEGAFWGVVQSISSNWAFLADLSRPDRLVVFSEEPKPISLLLLQFDYSSLNILPLAWGVLMYFNQKLMAQPATTDQARQTQMIMRIMTLFFPVLLYSAPSGLMLYITASSIAGMLDSYMVRRHIKKEEEAGTLFAPKEPRGRGGKDDDGKPKKEGFFARMQKELESRMEEQQRSAGGGKGRGRSGGAPGTRRMAAAERAAQASREKSAKSKPRKNKPKKRKR